MECNNQIEWAMQMVAFDQGSTENVRSVVAKGNLPENPHKQSRLTYAQVQTYLAACKAGTVAGRELFEFREMR